jgi:hypothetical protein
LVLVFLKHAGQILQAVGYSGPLLIQMDLVYVGGVRWLYPPGGMPYLEWVPGSLLDNDVTFSIDTTTDAVCERPDGVAMDVLRYVFFSVNWPELIVPQNFEQVVRGGYKFNYWPEPANLRV